MPSSKRVHPGAAVSVNLGGGQGVAFGRVLRPPVIEFFDLLATDCRVFPRSTLVQSQASQPLTSPRIASAI